MDRRAFLGLGLVAPAVAITPTPEPEQKSVIRPKERLEYLAELKQLRERLNNQLRAKLTLLDMGFNAREAEFCYKDLAKGRNSSFWQEFVRKGIGWYWCRTDHAIPFSYLDVRMAKLYDAILVTFRTGLDGFAILDVETPWLVRNEDGLWERLPHPKTSRLG